VRAAKGGGVGEVLAELYTACQSIGAHSGIVDSLALTWLTQHAILDTSLELCTRQ